MAMINAQTSIPEIGDTVKDVKQGFEPSVTVVTFESGKVIVFHTDADDGPQVKEGEVVDPEDYMIPFTVVPLTPSMVEEIQSLLKRRARDPVTWQVLPFPVSYEETK